MSYILEALRKSERERQAGQAAPPVPIPLNQAPPRRRGLAWSAAFLIVLNGAVLGYLWLTRWGNNGPVTQPTAAESAGPTVEPAAVKNAAAPGVTAVPSDSVPVISSPEEIPQPAKDMPPALARTEQAPAAQRPEAKADNPVNPPVTPPKPSKPKSAPSESTERSPTPITEKRLGKPAEKTRQPIDQEPLTESAASENANPPVAFRAPASAPETRDPPPRPLADEPAIPFIHALPIDFQQRVGPITINVFAYSEQPEERFAIIDMKKYRVGDSIQGGAELLEIRSDSLVLRTEGRKFRIPRP